MMATGRGETTETGAGDWPGREVGQDIGQDVSACDAEPIHVPGSIQPHGLLLIVDAALSVVGGAGDVERLADGWLGMALADLLGVEAAGRLAAAGEAGAVLGPVDGHPALHAVARRGEDAWLVTIEPVGRFGASGDDVLGWMEEAGTALERAPDLQRLCEEGVRLFRGLTGFDRVMIYRFLDDDSGVVLAEERADGLDGFLHHHFPASDIPRQARALYVRNRVRVIPDVDYAPQPIRPAALAGIDLSDVDVRSVSPIHIEYLRNMGVRASASVSIVKDGVLWGLIACHHRSPRGLSYTQRQACQLIASALARQVRAKEEAEDYRERLRVRAVEDAVVARMGDATDPEQLFASAGVELQRMLAADGFAVLHGDSLLTVGRCPDRDDVREVARWLRPRGATPFHSANLPADLPSARAYQDLASGVLGFTLSLDVPTVLIWFRAEERQLVEWAGNPHKAVSLAPGERLTPRTSFEAWTEEVRGRSRRWSAPEVEAAHRLVRTLFEARQTRRIRDLNRDLTAAVADKDALLAQKDTLMKEVNHRVQNSLQLVQAFLGMQARAANDEALTRHLEEAQRRLSAVALVHRRLYGADHVATIDLARYIEDLLADMQQSMGAAWSDRLTLDLAPILISADAAVQVGLVLVELIINAQKYAYGGAAGPVSVVLEQHRNRFRLIVADRGIGRSGTREGFGTRMLRAVVKGLRGTLEESDGRPGLRVAVTAPIEQAANGGLTAGAT